MSSNVHAFIANIPCHVRDEAVFSTKTEVNLTAIGSLSYAKLVRHLAELRIENIQRLLRPVVQKMIQHPRNINIFNQPVDPAALNIPDYYVRIKQPMDFGTIKSRLLRGEYGNVDACAADIRLVFQNATFYNPPSHLIHQIAKIMEDDFEIEMRALREKCSREVRISHFYVF